MAREYFTHLDNMEAIHPRFGFCPAECQMGFDIARAKKCDDCPARTHDEGFRRRTMAAWERTLGSHLFKFKFETVQRIMHDAATAQDHQPSRMSVYMKRIAEIYDRERRFHDDKDRYKRRKAAETAGNG